MGAETAMREFARRIFQLKENEVYQTGDGCDCRFRLVRVHLPILTSDLAILWCVGAITGDIERRQTAITWIEGVLGRSLGTFGVADVYNTDFYVWDYTLLKPRLAVMAGSP